MESSTNLEIETTVLGLLENADMSEMTEYKLRKLAGQKLGQELSDAKSKKLVRNIVEGFLRFKNSEEEQAAKQFTVEREDEEVEEEDEKASKKEHKKEQVQFEEEEEDEEDERPAKKQRKEKSKESGAVQKTGTDDNGDLVICKLSDRRSVTVQNFRGQKLVSVREFYEKDGKLLPSSKGISLKKEQWEAFKKGVPAIEAAIEKIKEDN